ncbi:keratin, type I cytoskeletal 19-like isoform X1 [Sardina pilchardus]|uniref:keratin, type I cytoskeletal 19-like isoform X1 n=1 Tax=Sardina pilchardus TaxID=27697 RepID=UPI002E0D6E10
MSVRVSRSSSSSSYSSSGGAYRGGFSSASGMRLGGIGGSGSSISLYGSRRAPSVYGGAGGYGTRISSSVSSVSMAASGGDMMHVANEKHTMQNLNDRLASYLEKVRSLEEANRKLELQIKGFCQKIAPERKDLSGYHVTIEDIRRKILDGLTENARITLQIDNAKLAAEDFQLKHQNEMAMRMSVEGDIAGLKAVLSEMQMSCGDMNIEIKGLNEELVWLKRNHEEELQALRVQQSGSVNVEVDCAPPVDLEKVIQEVREQYEAAIQKSRSTAEKWFESKVATLQTQMTTSVTEVKTCQSEVTTLQRTYQSLQIELQGLHSVKGNLERQLSEVSSRYGMTLSQLQMQIDSLEAELKQLTLSIEQQGAEYKMLLDIKMRLEREIAEYRRLLDGDAWVSTVQQVTQVTQVTQVVEEVVEEEEDEYNPHRQRRVKVIVEEMVDGVVVSSSVDEKLQEVA